MYRGQRDGIGRGGRKMMFMKMDDMAKKKEFDYSAAVAELEEIASKVESADTGIDDIDRYIKRASELIAACRAYLRTAGEKLEGLDIRE